MAVGSTSNWSAFYSQWFIIQACPVANSHITNWRNHHVLWVNQLFLWPSWIAFCMFTRGYDWDVGLQAQAIFSPVSGRRWFTSSVMMLGYTRAPLSRSHMESVNIEISHDISWYLMISHDISWYLLFSESSKGSSSNAIVFLAICRAPGNHP